MSSGRWEIGRRKRPGCVAWVQLRAKLRGLVVDAAGGEVALERECFAMARGEGGCKLVQNEELLESLREVLGEFCERGDEKFMEVAEGQPFRVTRTSCS